MRLPRKKVPFCIIELSHHTFFTMQMTSVESGVSSDWSKPPALMETNDWSLLSHRGTCCAAECTRRLTVTYHTCPYQLSACMWLHHAYVWFTPVSVMPLQFVTIIALCIVLWSSAASVSAECLEYLAGSESVLVFQWLKHISKPTLQWGPHLHLCCWLGNLLSQS